MNTTHHPQSTHRLGSFTTLATAAVLAVGVGVAVMGLNVGTASADPVQAIHCPAFYELGKPFTVELDNWTRGGTVTVSDFHGPQVGAYVDGQAVAQGPGAPTYVYLTVDRYTNNLEASEFVDSRMLSAKCYLQWQQ